MPGPVLGADSVADFVLTPSGPLRTLTVRLGHGAALPARQGSAVLDAAGTPLPRTSAFQTAAVTGDGVGAYVFDPAVFALDGAGGARLTGPLSADGQAVLLTLYVPGPDTPDLVYRFDPPHPGPLTIRVHSRDLLTLTRTDGPYDLRAEGTGADGSAQVTTFPLRLDLTAPTGSATYQRSAGYGGYVLLSTPDADVTRVAVTWPDGTRDEVPILIANAFGVAGVARAQDDEPVAVVAIDAAGNASGNVLTRVERTEELRASATTPLSPWPLPPFLDATRPQLARLLAAFAAGLDLAPEAQAHQADPRAATDVHLDRVAGHFGVVRRAAEEDTSVLTRLTARLLPDKSTRAGLSRHATLLTGQPVQVLDGRSQLDAARTLNGTWRLDGTVQLGGELNSEPIGPGRVRVTVKNPPPDWAALPTVVRRHVSAGIVAEITALLPLADLHLTPTLSAPGTLELQHTLGSAAHARPYTHLRGRVVTSARRLDGSWQLDGRVTLGRNPDEQATEL